MDSNIYYYVGKTIDDRYEITDVIGEGGMAVVYKAICHRLNRYVAVKIMRPEFTDDDEFRTRFRSESQAIAMLSHANIAAVYDVNSSDELEYIVMELIEGITLKQYIDKKGSVSWNEVVHFSRQIARALSHAHSRGVIHRDIKPHNIMLLRDGTIKVADFGIAALENEVYENKGEAIGSIHYISPEQARGEVPDARGDVYSLGIVMYEMLTGRLPYSGGTLQEIADKHAQAAPQPIAELAPETPERLIEITMKAMDPDITRRYASADELLNDLDDFSRSVSTEVNVEAEEDYPEEDETEPMLLATEVNSVRYRRRKQRSRRVSFFSGFLGLLAFILLLFVFLWNYWLKDIFAPTVRIALPDFTGYNYFEIIRDAGISGTYNFDVDYIISDSYAYGTIISQNPKPGRSMMLNPTGVNVEISVSTGATMIAVPDVTGLDYREASLRLTNAGLNVEMENELSDTVERDKVISTSPIAGEKISNGSTVYIQVSSGQQITYVEMPQLVGATESAAITKLEAAGLSYAGSKYVESEFEAGTVVGQNIAAFTQIEEHTGVYLEVSAGR